MSPTIADITERDVQRAVLDWVNMLPGFRVWRNNTGAVTAEHKGIKRFVRFGVPGQADLTGVAPGGVRVEIEVKGPRGRLSENQVRWLEDIAKAGGIAFHANSLDMCIEAMRTVFAARGWPWRKEWEL